jgi:site-specific DNA-methyltransferase (adenine-specific)
VKPYWTDGQVTLYLGDCREVTEWLAADVLVTDPPYGIGWKRGRKSAHDRGGQDQGHPGITGDKDTGIRDAALVAWGSGPAAVFGSFYAPQPAGVRHVLVFRKPPDAGVIGSTTGWRRDLEPIFLLGAWPQRVARSGSLIESNAQGAGHLATRHGHPHAKPVDVMETLIAACPPGVIADPFAGAGSTLVGARNQGRKAIGVELEERYCEQAARRLSQGVLLGA